MCASPLIHNKGVHQHQLYFPLDRFLSKATVRAAQKILGSCRSSKHTYFPRKEAVIVV
ncbi:hypothetical protein D0Y65_027156 [Glycine soja]|uniref:Uncharacterized protein n=1 Tax=Glycine soja TaxID=3848 RepID=A0A445IMY2_GLYSO|nr:hypothetical protein glysoja_012092 [Glycine soja]RZB87393.1 hypothetical protein D0Y65_027156 [Glycine soja]